MLSSMRYPSVVAASAFAIIANASVAVRTNVVERSYDRFGRLAGLSVDGERRTEIAYDGATGRIASMRVAGADEPFRWEYEPGSDLKKSLSYPNGAKVTWEYEPHRDFVTLVSNDVYSSFRYAYDAAGRRVSKNDDRYEYNERGELILATNAVTGAEFAYRYDDIGNRLWSRELGTNCVYAANELNQYTNVVRGGVFERSTFDLDGNQTNVVTSTGEWAVEYNGENRPVRWTRASDGATVLMAFDRMGRRVRKNDEVFVYDGYLNVSETVWDPTEPVATRPLVWRGEDGEDFLFHDGNKNVADSVSTSSSSAVRHYHYTPFGVVMAEMSDDVVSWRFSSECYDGALGLVGYNYRHLDVLSGRWIVRDWLWEDGGGNLYAFCGNDAVGAFDVIGGASMADIIRLREGLRHYMALLSQAAKELRNCVNTVSDWRPGGSRDSLDNDKYRHCVASCEITRACGSRVAWTLGILKEVRDILFGIPQGVAAGFEATNIEMSLDLILNGDGLMESINDLKADSLGIDAGNANGDCKCACQKHYEP